MLIYKMRIVIRNKSKQIGDILRLWVVTMACLRGCETIWRVRWDSTGIREDGVRGDVLEWPVITTWILWILAVSERNIFWEWESEYTRKGNRDCIREWFPSRCKCLKMRKIHSISIQIKYSIKSMYVFHRMNNLPLWMWWIEEDPINKQSNQILDRIHEFVS